MGASIREARGAVPADGGAVDQANVDPACVDAVLVDLDNTLVDGLALFHLGRALAGDRVAPRSAVARLAAHHLWYRLVGENQHLTRVVRRSGLALAAGLDADTALAAAERAFSTAITPRLRAGTLDLLADYLAAGVPVWVVTASPAELAELVARRLGLTGGLGTRVDRADGAFTGRLDGPVLHGPAKAAAAAGLARAHGWDLRRCVALSDGFSDLPLLQAVGHPVAINPDRRLRRAAAARGWPIHDFRAPRHRRVTAAAGLLRSRSAG